MKVFSKEKFIEKEGYNDYLVSRKWVDECDGKPVRDDFCGVYVMDDTWCIEVHDAVEETAKILDKFLPKGFPKPETKPAKEHCPVPDYQITITCWGDTTHAQMFVNGHKVKETKVKRNPADKFNWRIGAQTAFNRLWEKKKKPENPKKPAALEVKRYAEPGEWVKVVKAYGSSYETYKTGDVLKVKCLFTMGIESDGWVYLEGYEECACAPDEYVVLEGYQPE